MGHYCDYCTNDTCENCVASNKHRPKPIKCGGKRCDLVQCLSLIHIF